MKCIRKLFLVFFLIISIVCVQSDNVEAAKSKINKSKVSIYVGKTVTLKVTKTKGKVIWKSSKKSIATVSKKGKVTAKKAGTAIITANVQNKKYKCKVTVKNPYLNKKNVTLQEGESVTLKITGTKAEKWSSSNEDVVSISSKGKVTANKSGKATIICKGKNGKNYKCTVIVTEKKEEEEKHIHEYICCKETEPTCQKEGVKEYVCNGCGEKKTEYIKKTAHNIEKKITKESTCKEEGEMTYSCKVCGEVEKTEKLEKAAHAIEKTVTKESTCKEEGEATYACKVCGEVEKTEVIEKTGHTIEKTVMKESTCKEEGEATYTCKVCGIVEKTEVIEKTGHVIEKTVTKESTCKEEGEATYTCKVCGTVEKTEVIEKTSHAIERQVTKESTCEKEGEATYICKVCGTVEKKEIIETKEHQWTEKYIEPTCTSVGGKLQKCKNCTMEFYTEMEDILPHEYETKVVDATCSENGYTLHQCKNCEEKYITDYTDMIEHQYQLKYISMPDCENSGIRSEVCKMCNCVNREVWEVIEPFGHEPVMETVNGEPVGRCDACQEHLFTVQFHTRDLSKVNQTMSYMENNTIHCVPGLHMNVYLYEMTWDGTKGITLKLDNAKCLEGTTIVMDEETGEEKEEPCYYYENEVVRLKDERVIALEKGETKIQICYEDEVIGEVPVSIDGYSLPEAVRQKMAGSTEDVTKGYIDRYVEMVDTTVAIFKEVTTEDMTKIEKAKALFRWMEDNIIYGAGGTILRGQKAWETLSTKKAVCGGYAETAMFFMDVLEVPSYYLISQPPSGEGHAWNMIYIDTGNGKGENWYYIDTTWGEYDFTTTVDEMNAENAMPGLWGLHRAMEGYQYGVGRYMGSSIGTKNIDISYVSPLYE